MIYTKDKPGPYDPHVAMINEQIHAAYKKLEKASTLFHNRNHKAIKKVIKELANSGEYKILITECRKELKDAQIGIIDILEKAFDDGFAVGKMVNEDNHVQPNTTDSN